MLCDSVLLVVLTNEYTDIVYRYCQSHTTHFLRTFDYLATSFDLVYRSSSRKYPKTRI